MTYEIDIAGLKRNLPLCKVSDDLYIGAFVMFGDVEMTVHCAAELLKRAPEYDYIIAPEAKSIPLLYEMARQSGADKYFLARKGPKAYMSGVFEVNVKSITTMGVQKLVIDSADAELIKGKRMLIIDDVISTGESLRAMEELVHQAGGAIEEVDSYLQQRYLASPADGIISSVYPRQGELVGQGSPVATVTDLSDIWFTFNIREDELHSMQTGDVLTVKVPALDGRTLKARVNYMAVRESYATWKATKETDQYDAKTFEVRAVPEERAEGLRPGMTVLVVK